MTALTLKNEEDDSYRSKKTKKGEKGRLLSKETRGRDSANPKSVEV